MRQTVENRQTLSKRHTISCQKIKQTACFYGLTGTQIPLKIDEFIYQAILLNNKQIPV